MCDAPVFYCNLERALDQRRADSINASDTEKAPNTGKRQPYHFGHPVSHFQWHYVVTLPSRASYIPMLQTQRQFAVDGYTSETEANIGASNTVHANLHQFYVLNPLFKDINRMPASLASI